MIEVYKTDDGILSELDSYKNTEGVWLNLINPTESEIKEVSEYFHIDESDLTAALDTEESSRVSIEDGYNLVIIDIPLAKTHDSKYSYTTFPLGIIVKDAAIITICSDFTPIMQHFSRGKQRGLSTKKKIRFIYQILLRSAESYQQHLRTIDKLRVRIEKRADSEIRDTDLIKLHALESALVYFETSLRANLVVLDRLRRYDRIEQYPEDVELLDDVEIEYKQAIETTTIYRGIIDGTGQLLSAMIDKKLNKTMRLLTSITIVMAVPTIISGIFGMNLATNSIPFASYDFGFPLVCGIITLICIVVLIVMRKKKML